MTLTSRSLPALLVTGALAIALTGCSSPASHPEDTGSDGAPPPAANTGAPAPAGDALDACQIVNNSMLFATLKITVPDGVADNAETCTYTADGISVVVQTSTQASLYFPKDLYAASAVAGSIDLAGGDVGYGYYLPPSGSDDLGNVQVFVAKGEKAVFLTGNVLAPGTTQDVLNLATAISIAF